MFQAANDVTLLVPQDAGENQYTCWFQTRAPKWDRTNQQFAEKIRGDDIKFLRRAMFGCIGDFEFDSGDSVQALVTLGDRNRVRVAIDCDYSFCAKYPRAQSRECRCRFRHRACSNRPASGAKFVRAFANTSRLSRVRLFQMRLLRE